MNTKTTKLSKISNTLFLSSIIFCLFFLWCNYYTKNLKLSLISSIIVFFAFLIIYIPIKLAVSQKKTNKKKEIEKFDNFKLQLQYSKSSNILKLIEKELNINNYQKISDNHFFVNNSFDIYIYTSVHTPVENIIQNRISDNIYILCLEKISIPVHINNINITILDSVYLFKLLDSDIPNTLDKVITIKKPKYRLKDIVCIVLCREKSRNYFWLGVLLLFSSLFTPFSTYYIIFATILFILSLISRFNSILFKPKTNIDN